MQDRNEVSARRGLGLGLHIVKQLVELHDGSVQATSEGNGLGTTITIQLPLHGERTAAPSEHVLAEPRSLSRLHVLVVDDEADERELIGEILERAGAEVMCADGIAAALAVFETWRPDAVVTDIAMPDVDGCGCSRLCERATRASPRSRSADSRPRPRPSACSRAASTATWASRSTPTTSSSSSTKPPTRGIANRAVMEG
jgi:CheY-like chemotaxis protein